MRITPLLLTISLCCGMNTAVLADRNIIPDDYPTHKQPDGCMDPVSLAVLQQKLQEYNVTRVQLAEVLHTMANSYHLEGEVRKDLLSFAEYFENIGKEMPQPDPDSDEFRNFDFKLGLSLTAVTVFLNTRDESLTRRFHADRDNPDSVVGLYLADLDRSREAYMSGLQDFGSTGNDGTCS